MKLFLITLFSITFCFAQDTLPMRYSYRLDKSSLSFTVNSPLGQEESFADSLIIKDYKKENFFKSTEFFNNKSLTKSYKRDVFGYKSNNRYIQQWKTTIKIYFDAQFSKETISEFKYFLKDFNNIKNLKVTVVKSLEDANFFFKIYEYHVTAYDSEVFKSLTTEDYKTSLYSHMTYNMRTNTNRQVLSNLVKVSKSELEKDYLLSNLKKIFYLSLGNFSQSYYAEKYSILNYNTEIVEKVSDYDSNIIRYHYDYIFPFLVNKSVFKTVEDFNTILKNE